MIKVLQVIPTINGGGVSEVAKNIIKTMSEKCDFDIATHQPLKEEVRKEIGKNINNVYVIKRLKKSGYFGYIRQFRKILKVNKYDAVHIHSDLLAWIPAKVAKKQGVKVIVGHAHGQEFLNYPKLLIKFIEPICQYLNRKYINSYVGCSAESIKHMFNCDGVLIPNFIAPQKILHLNDDEKLALKTELNIPNDAFIIGYAGRLDNKKNAIFLPDVLKTVNDDHVYMILAGDAFDFSAIKQKISDYGLDERIKVLGFRNDMDTLYNIFDVYMTASLSEGMSLSLIQAQMMGIPCVVYKGAPDINDLGCDIFFKCNTFELEEWKQKFLLAKSMVNKISQDEIKNRLKRNGKDVDQVVEKLQLIYNGQ